MTVSVAAEGHDCPRDRQAFGSREAVWVAIRIGMVGRTSPRFDGLGEHNAKGTSLAKGEILPRYILSVPVTIAYLEFPSLIWGAQERAAKAAVGAGDPGMRRNWESGRFWFLCFL